MSGVNAALNWKCPASHLAPAPTAQPETPAPSATPETPQQDTLSVPPSAKRLNTKYISLGYVTHNDLGLIRTIHETLCPKFYGPRYYALLAECTDFCRIAYINDIPVGVICCKLDMYDRNDDAESNPDYWEIRWGRQPAPGEGKTPSSAAVGSPVVSDLIRGEKPSDADADDLNRLPTEERLYLTAPKWPAAATPPPAGTNSGGKQPKKPTTATEKRPPLAARLYILTLLVLEPYQGCGVGSTLLEWAQSFAQSINLGTGSGGLALSASATGNLLHTLGKKGKIDSIFLHVWTENRKAIALYEKMGFTPVCNISSYYRSLIPPSCIVYKKDLRPLTL